MKGEERLLAHPPGHLPSRDSVCFGVGQSTTPVCRFAGTGLSDNHAEAFAELLQVLACGEESAVLVFEHLGNAAPIHADANVELVRIAAEEQEHERLLRALRLSLPTPRPDEALIVSARRLFKLAANRDVGLHLAAIAALDSGLCLILAALRRRTGPLAQSGPCNTVLGRIHRDEARHFECAMRFTKALAPGPAAQEVAVSIRERLVALLSRRAEAFERLEVNPLRLFGRLRIPPLLDRD